MTMLRYLAVLLCARLSIACRAEPVRAGDRLRSAEQGLPGRPCCAEHVRAGHAVMVTSGLEDQGSPEGWAGHGG